MKTQINIFVLKSTALLGFATLFGQTLYSQNINDSKGKVYAENLIINTDRSIYITGERVWLNVTTINALTNTPASNSKVAYVEFLDKNNFPLKQLKVAMENSSGASVFIIPENLASGNYVIRAYTNWMQNWPADQFCHKTISVINPFGGFESLTLLTGEDNSAAENIVDRTVSPKFSLQEGKEKSITYKITTSKAEYSSREKVKVEIHATDGTGKPIETDLSIAIAKSGIVNSADVSNSSFGTIQTVDLGSLKIDSSIYLPELEGHLIYGIIKNKETGEPIRNSGISLSFVGKIARCQFSKTNENGEFYFVVREPGTNEIVIQPLDPDLRNYYVDLKQSFNSNFSVFQPPLLKIDSNNIENINNAVISMQINTLYEPFRQKTNASQTAGIADFYGEPENTIVMADFIELTTIKEVVKEIIPNVYTLRQNGKYDLKLINKFQSLPFENKPMVLVDGVPIYDFEKVLGISSKETERANVINKRYFYSEFVFDGILSFITKKGDLSALEYDNSVFRQVYEGCLPKEEFYSPEYTTDSLKSSRIPDYRNTLYWNPDKHTDKDGKTYVEFYTSDESTEYTIVINGISTDGKRGYSTAVLKVN